MWSLDSDLVAAIHLFFQQVFAQPLVGQSDRNDVYRALTNGKPWFQHLGHCDDFERSLCL